nr:hypothetical protein 6 [bacterium]
MKTVHTTNRFFNGVRVTPGEEVKGTPKQIKDLVDCGQAEQVPTEVPTESNTKQEIMDYLVYQGVEFDSGLTKAELLELL